MLARVFSWLLSGFLRGAVFGALFRVWQPGHRVKNNCPRSLHERKIFRTFAFPFGASGQQRLAGKFFERLEQ